MEGRVTEDFWKEEATDGGRFLKDSDRDGVQGRGSALNKKTTTFLLPFVGKG